MRILKRYIHQNPPLWHLAVVAAWGLEQSVLVTSPTWSWGLGSSDRTQKSCFPGEDVISSAMKPAEATYPFGSTGSWLSTPTGELSWLPGYRGRVGGREMPFCFIF